VQLLGKVNSLFRVSKRGEVVLVHKDNPFAVQLKMALYEFPGSHRNNQRLVSAAPSAGCRIDSNAVLPLSVSTHLHIVA
jgi:hypothetical protein